MKADLPILTVRCPRSIIAAIESRAKAEGADKSTLIRRILCEYLGLPEPVILQGFAELPKRKLRAISRKGVESRKKDS